MALSPKPTRPPVVSTVDPYNCRIRLLAPKLEYYPYPHIVVPNAVPQKAYEQLVEEFPEEEILKKPHGENQRIDLHAKESRGKVSELWQAFIDYHTSEEWWFDVLHTFGEAIYVHYPGLTLEKSPEAWSTSPRGCGEGFLQLECQPGVNTPQSDTGRVRGPHLDNPIELFGALLYMGHGEGDLEIHKLVRQPKFYGKLEIKDECVEVVKTVKYRPNTLIMFLNTITSIHGVTARGPTDECRRLVSIAGELPKQLFKVGHGKY